MSVFAHLIALPIRFYQLAISPLTGASCRFQPTCSAYALTSLKRHGALKGGVLSVKRMVKCHPWGGCGHDPVPEETKPMNHPHACHGGASQQGKVIL